MSTTPPEALLRLEAVKARVGLSRSLIYRLVSEAKFPSPLHISHTRVSVWTASAVDRWIADQIQEATTGADHG